MQCPRCQYENPASQKFCGECGTSLALPNQGGRPAASYADLQREVEHLARALSEALEQRTATSEILRTIAQARTDAQPVFDTIVQSAARLCHGANAAVFLTDGRMVHQPANYGSSPPEALAAARARFPRPLDMATMPGVVISTRSVVHVPDTEEPAAGSLVQEVGRLLGFRSTVAVPMLREGVAIGSINVARREPGRFSNAEVELLRTFADQAVIAIENVRLFTELQASNRELTTALDQQTATSDILRVISRSQTNVQPVFDAIIDSAVRLLGGHTGALTRIAGEQIELAALTSTDPAGDVSLRALFPQPLRSEAPHAQVIRDRAPLNIGDAQTDSRVPETVQASARARGYRSWVTVPLLRHDGAVGTIAVTRQEPGGFTGDEIALLQTFADQAVIAIENVRLFTELQAKNADLTESLEQQTATSEILRVIAGSPTDVQPVFEAIVRSAVVLCGGRYGAVYRRFGDIVECAALHGLDPDAESYVRRNFPRPVTAGRARHFQRALLDGTVVSIADIAAEPGVSPETRDYYLRHEGRSVVLVPLVQRGEILGVLGVGHRNIAAFSDRHVELLKTFADQAVIAIENVRLFTELQEKNRALTTAHAQVSEALEQQTATAAVLRVIGSSPTDAQPVFEAIVSSARRLLGGFGGAVYRVAGDEIHLAAYVSTSPTGDAALRSSFPRPLAVFSPPGEAIRRRAPVVLTDVDTDGWVPDDIRELIRKRGDRSGVWVPMMREGVALGAIGVTRTEPGSFADEQIALLKTFADQAVIAIENVRLFTELQLRNSDLTEALEQQTATSEILRVISHSPTDVQPVFDAIAESSVRLCSAEYGSACGLEGDVIHLVAQHGQTTHWLDTAARLFPHPLNRDLIAGWAMLDRDVVHVEDMQNDARFPASQALARTMGYRTVLSVPMLRDRGPAGAIVVFRQEGRRFTDAEIALLRTFADQAVIAIENVRLFKELEARNRDLTAAHAHVTEALEQQTATAEILRVISRSQTDVQPVFDTIARSAVKLCDGLFSALFQFDGELLHQVAQHNYAPEALEELHRVFPARPIKALFTGRAILERAVVHIPDSEVDPDHQHRALRRAIGWRSGLFVPMLREGAPIGVIEVARAEPGPFSDSEIELLKTFADQAVIAVENVRLFKELQARTGELTQSVEKLTALGEVSRAVSSTLDVETVLDIIVSHASQLAGAAGCSIYEYDEGAEQFELRATHNADTAFVAALRAVRLRKGEGLMGRAAEMREPIQIPDITQPGAYQSSVRDTLIRFGYHALLSVPLLRENQIIGSLSFNRKAPGEFPPEVIEVLKTFATQSALAIQNARLFREIADKSAQLGAASRHKSEFLANMSHELRTPLNAIIGFSEVLAQGMFGEVNDKQAEYLHDILESGQHLLSLINDILDLSKIEAGRMELEASEFDLPQAIQNALTLVRERALRRGIALHHVIDDRVADIRADERKVKQVLLNLLSNAIKFTPEGGRIEVRAASTDRMVEVSVTDTGVGIAPEDQETVFEEFRQVGTADKKAEGTGLGLALSRKFIELHGGRISVRSQVGTGSTFTLPIR